MFTKISVLVPTRGRIERLKTLLSSFDATVKKSDAELVFRVDDDDLETQEFLLGENVVVGPRHKGYESMSAFFNESFTAATGDVLMCGNDDMVFRTPGWAAVVLAAANRYPDGLFDIGVNTMNEEHYPFSIVSRIAAERLGFVWDPLVFWGDIYLRDVMAAFDRCVMLPEVRVEHDWAGFRPDKTYLDAIQPGEINKDIIRRDPNYWVETHSRAVADAVGNLKELFA